MLFDLEESKKMWSLLAKPGNLGWKNGIKRILTFCSKWIKEGGPEN